MLGRSYERENCSAARALEVSGERWSLLIIRNALYAGHTRFNQFQQSLGIATNVLTARLDWLIDNELMQSTTAADGARHYVLTPKGLDLEPVVLALCAWGDKWAAPDGPPILFHHRGCGGSVRQHLQCAECNAPLEPGDVETQFGPGMPVER